MNILIREIGFSGEYKYVVNTDKNYVKFNKAKVDLNAKEIGDNIFNTIKGWPKKTFDPLKTDLTKYFIFVKENGKYTHAHSIHGNNPDNMKEFVDILENIKAKSMNIFDIKNNFINN